MPYRIDVTTPPPDAVDRACHLGALDVGDTPDGFAAIMPDSVDASTLRHVFGAGVTISPAVGRDADSVWVLEPRLVRTGRLVIALPHADAPSASLRLEDTGAFGTGLHPTTRLCLDALEQELAAAIPERVLDVGTGSGVLALAALRLGVPRATAVDVEPLAIAVATRNAELNQLRTRVDLVLGGPEAVQGQWPLVLANVLAAPLIDMAAPLAGRVGHHGRLVMSGIPHGVVADVARIYRDRGMHLRQQETRAGWSLLLFQASW